MTPDEVRKALLRTLTEIQQFSGRPVPAFSDALCPAEDLEGLDSQNAEEAAVMLEQELIAKSIRISLSLKTETAILGSARSWRRYVSC